jgi:hypothetical protein
VGTADDGSPLFEPLYFKPHPEGVFQKHPVNVKKEIYGVRQLSCIPTLPDALDTVRKTSPASEDILEVVQRLLDKRL